MNMMVKHIRLLKMMIYIIRNLDHLINPFYNNVKLKIYKLFFKPYFEAATFSSKFPFSLNSP